MQLNVMISREGHPVTVKADIWLSTMPKPHEDVRGTQSLELYMIRHFLVDQIKLGISHETDATDVIRNRKETRNKGPGLAKNSARSKGASRKPGMEPDIRPDKELDKGAGAEG